LIAVKNRGSFVKGARKIAITRSAVLAKMYHKPFGSRALPRPARGAYSAPTDSLATLRVWGPWEGDEEDET